MIIMSSKIFLMRFLFVYSFLFIDRSEETRISNNNNKYVTETFVNNYDKNILPKENDDNFPVLGLTLGYVRGQWLYSARGRRYAAYKGIPYAQSPLGILRFEPPLERKPWRGVRNAFNHGPQCPQLLIPINRLVGDEDCLYLNLYIPQPDRRNSARNSQDELLPVIFFIHGGSFAIGSGDMDDYLYGPDRLMDEGVILVTINYRLGALGFLHLEERVPGNMGLKDQSMALRLIKANARSFGGDPKRIVIMGESAGAASAEYHTMNPESTKIISGVIAQSGSALAAWAWSRPNVLADRTRRLARSLNCPNLENPKLVIDCLKRVSAKDIIRYQMLTDWSPLQLSIGVSFTPTAEPRGTPNSFIEDCPRNVLARMVRTRHRVPFLTGYNTAEGQLFTKILVSVLDSLFQAGAKRRLDFIKEPKSVAYLKRKPFIEQPSPPLIDNILGDYQFKGPIIDSSRFHDQAGSSVYLYHFSFAGRNNLFRLFWNSETPTHMDELTYLFEGRGLFGGLPKLETATPEATVSEHIIRMWTNFAKTGNPTPSNKTGVDILWPPGPSKLLIIGRELTVANTPMMNSWQGFLDRQCFL